MSQSERGTPRWSEGWQESVLDPGVVGLPALIAGLPGSRTSVEVGPPLALMPISSSGSIGSVALPIWLPSAPLDTPNVQL